jgi:hypothetical protein
MRDDGPLHNAAARLKEAAAAKKCWPCGCLHHALEAIERAVPLDQRFTEFATVLETARARLEPVRYDCLGCDVCYPALALNALARAGSEVIGDVCPSEAVQPRAGWPPLPGSYTVLRYQAPDHTRTFPSLAAAIATLRPPTLILDGEVSSSMRSWFSRFERLCQRDTEAVATLPDLHGLRHGCGLASTTSAASPCACAAPR